MLEKIKGNLLKIVSVLASGLLVVGGIFVIKNREDQGKAVDDLAGSASEAEEQTSSSEEVSQEDSAGVVQQATMIEDPAKPEIKVVPVQATETVAPAAQVVTKPMPMPTPAPTPVKTSKTKTKSS